MATARVLGQLQQPVRRFADVVLVQGPLRLPQQRKQAVI
jgi:hypothetical protein